jgi:hypothetical protein
MAPAASLLWKLWRICYNKYLIDLNRRFPNPVLNSETSIVSKGDTIPEEDRIYNEEKPNFFRYNNMEYWIINPSDKEALINFGMTKPKKDDVDKDTNALPKDETQSAISEKDHSDTESEKFEKTGRRK